MINVFFNSDLEAILNEKNELKELFKLNINYYKKSHHGVCNLYETTFED